MVIKWSIRGITFVLLIIGIFSAATAITLTPSGDQSVSDNSNATRNFSMTIGQNASVNWYLNGTSVKSEANVTSSYYLNTSAVTGFWNVSVIAVNSSNSSDIAMTRWWWTVIAPTVVETAPTITNPNAGNITDTTADITFNVDQIDAKTRVKYGVDSSLSSGIWSGWQNSTPRTIHLSGLNKSTTYYYSIYAYNGTNESLFSNSTPIQSFTTRDPTAPNVSVDSVTLSSTKANITFSISQTDAKTGVYYGITQALELGPVWGNTSGSPRTISLSLSEGTKYYYSVYAYNGSNQSYSSNTSIYNFTTPFSPPSIASYSPMDTTIKLLVGQSQIFRINATQNVTVNWYINDALVPGATKTVDANQEANYTFNADSVGNYTIKANASNANGSITKSWTVEVHSKTYSTGNRVWDGSKDMSTTYTWNPMSFYAFYYDVDSNVGDESLTIYLDSKDDRNIQRGSLKYSTTPDSVQFKYKGWGKYNVIGFMAKKYFAAYTSETSNDITDGKSVSTLGYGQLHEVLMDDYTQKAVYAGSTLTLGEGYVLKVQDVGAGRVVMLTLLKDGGEVDTGFVESGKTYKYVKRVGAANDLTVIAVHVESVFMGREANAAFIKGIFQISESYTSTNSNNRYGIMEITGASASGITMENRDSITLSQGATIDIMGDMKFIVADNSSVLRFAPMVKRSGTYEVRGTIAANDTNTFEWTPMNFEGFYYNLNDDVGTEKLSITRIGTTVNKEALKYTTTPQAVSYKYKKFGSFNVVGFMADKYFAGYIGSGCTTCITTTDINTMGYKQLHRILIDDDTQRVVYAGSTLTLNEGYVLKIKDVNMGAGSAEVWLSLLKDGNEVDSDVVSAGQVYTYAPSKTGVISELPIIAVRVENIFRGKEATAAFMKGVFQISENPTRVNNGDHYGIMEISDISNNFIEMKNPSSFTLSSASTFDVMGNIKFKVADSADVRFYPFIMANGSALASNQLTIDAPATPMVRDLITITVASGSGTLIDNAEVSFDGSVIGNTNSTGKVEYVLTKSGQHTITATKLGYEKATKTIQVSEFKDTTLKFELPAFLDQGIPVTIKVISNGTAISGANVTFDGKAIGLTDRDGILKYTFDVSGTHNLGASKTGYISVVREISIRMPFTEFKAIDVNFTPAVVFTNQKYFVWANVTNVGTKNGTLPVGLVVNDTVVENKNVTLAPGATQEINFTQKMTLPPGNYSVEILGQKKIMEVKEEPFNIFLIGGIVTALGALIIYLSTTVKGKATLDLLTEKFNELITRARGK